MTTNYTMPPREDLTQRIARPGSPMGRPTQHIPYPRPQPNPVYGAPPGGPPPKAKRRFSLRNPLSVVLIIVIVFALIGGALIGAELYVRNAAVEKIQQAVACKIKGDGESTDDMLNNVNVSVATTPPVLWQYLTDDYTKLTISTRGDHIASAHGMTADIVIEDLKLAEDANKKGTVGSVRGKIDWTSDGILQTLNETVKEPLKGIQGVLDYVPGFVKDFLDVKDIAATGEVVQSIETDPSAGTLTLKGDVLFAIKLVVKPQVDGDGNIRLVIPPNGLTIGGETAESAQELVQEALDSKTKEITQNALSIKADSIEVTNDGVVANFSTQNADILKDDGSGTQGAPDECDL